MSHFDEMQMFVRIVDAGSISKAADQLGVAKSGVSRRLSDLEGRLGVKLINRTTRRSSLTEEGTAYYRGAVALLANVAELDASVASSEATLKGVLHVAVPLSFGLGHLAPAIREFIAAYNREHGATVLLTSHYMADVEALSDVALTSSRTGFGDLRRDTHLFGGRL